ncbi:glycosyltransferase family 2 protein [Bradyrhizobium australiense]|nr:glycosyltransferase family A protein [Bradyrhizobium australiense]
MIELQKDLATAILLNRTLAMSNNCPDHTSENIMEGGKLRIAVGIATAGRRAILNYTLDLIARQTRPPDALIVCPATPEDLHAELLLRFPYTTSVRLGKRGLTAQRNQILAAANASDVIVFFDDDFFPQLNYLEEIERLFLECVDVVAITGRPIVDGANGPGLEAEAALSLISDDRSAPGDRTVVPTYGTYGCNMAFRMAPIREKGLLFDENLPLYGWQEDIDFSRQLSGAGRIVDAKALRGVHLGAKGGRTSGVRFGYSQIANPVYLVRKGTVSLSFAGPLLFRNVLANLARSVRPEPWIDRRGRLKGNYLALRDLLTGRIAPQRILELG